MHCTALVGRLALPQVQVKVKLPDPFETSSSWERCLSELLQQESSSCSGAEWVGLKKQRPDLIFTLLDERKQGELGRLWSFSQGRAGEGGLLQDQGSRPHQGSRCNSYRVISAGQVAPHICSQQHRDVLKVGSRPSAFSLVRSACVQNHSDITPPTPPPLPPAHYTIKTHRKKSPEEAKCHKH